MVSVATGLEQSSYSLQYSQARLQRRMGMMCASSGWSVEASAFAIMRAPRRLRWSAFRPRRILVPLEGMFTALLEHRRRGTAPNAQRLGGFAERMEKGGSKHCG